MENTTGSTEEAYTVVPHITMLIHSSEITVAQKHRKAKLKSP